MIAQDKSMTFFSEEMARCFEESSKQIQQTYPKEQEKIEKDYLEQFDQLLLRCAKQQESLGKGKVALINICYLRSALFTEELELQINIYDEYGLFDPVETCVNIKNDYITQYFKRDLKELFNRANDHILKFDHRGEYELRNCYAMFYYYLLACFCEAQMEKIMKLPSFEALNKCENVEFNYGEYYGEIVPLAVCSENKMSEKV